MPRPKAPVRKKTIHYEGPTGRLGAKPAKKLPKPKPREQGPSVLGTWHAQATIIGLRTRGLLQVAPENEVEVINAVAALYDHARESAARSIGEAVIETGKALFRHMAGPALPARKP